VNGGGSGGSGSGEKTYKLLGAGGKPYQSASKGQ